MVARWACWAVVLCSLACGVSGVRESSALTVATRHLQQPQQQPQPNIDFGWVGRQCAAARQRCARLVCGARKTRILMLMSDTGGGHRASAEALSQALERQYPGEFDVTLYDIWTSSARWPWNRAVPAYRYLGRRPWLWRLLWYGTAAWPSRVFGIMLQNAQLRGRFVEAIERHRPDVVISVHPMCQHVPISALESMLLEKKIPFATVVTDLGSAHPLWFDHRADIAFVPTARVGRLARFHGLARSKVVEHGLPLRSAFCDAAHRSTTRRDREKAKRRARRKLHLDPEAPTVLIAGGGDGFGGLERVVEETAVALSGERRTTVVAVCGNNNKLRRRLSSKDWAKVAPKVKVEVTGFVSNMDIYMAASDVLLTKAGPGSIAEASAIGLPVLLTSYLPGQERGNVMHVIDSGFGALAKRPAKAGHLVATWLSKPDLLHKMAHNARAAAKPLATARIARDIANLAHKTNPKQQLRIPPPNFLNRRRG